MVPARLRRLAGAAVLATATFPTRAFAHTPSERLGDFWGGFLHPLVSLEHALPLLALAVLVAQQGRDRARTGVLLWPFAFAIGAALGFTRELPAFLPTANRIGFVVLGGLAAASWRLPRALGSGILIAAAIGHGFENAAGAIVRRPMLFGAGSVTGTTFVLLLLLGAVVSLRAGWPRLVPRVVASWIAAIGVMMLALGR
ncbi:MAG: HupE/UreJ family protein [bacterium]